MDSRGSILADAQPPETVQPRQRPLHIPTISPQATPVRRLPPGDPRSDAAPAQQPAMRVRIVAAVAEQRPRPSPRPARLAPHRRDRIDQFHHRHDVGDVRRRHRSCQGHPMGVGDHLVLAPLLPPVYRAGPGRPAPAPGSHEAAVDDRPAPVDLAGTLQLGQQDLVELGPDAGQRQSRRRRQQVIPEPQPISTGRSSQLIPVLRTNRMPVRAFRSSMRGRPGRSGRLGLGRGGRRG